VIADPVLLLRRTEGDDEQFAFDSSISLRHRDRAPSSRPPAPRS
jgi:hypothetical protein